jgi:hypothetical protein
MTATKPCDFFGCGNDAMPGSWDCEEHQHAISLESSDGTQVTVKCACGELLGPVGEPNDRRLQNRDDTRALHAAHAAST